MMLCSPAPRREALGSRHLFAAAGSAARPSPDASCLMASASSHTVVLIPGDGIGPEVTDAMRRILAAAGAQINWVERHAGVAALERGGDTVLPADTMNAIVEHGVAIKGPCTTP